MVHKRFPISLRELEVVAVRDVSSRLRRITLGGRQMGAFTSDNGFAIPPFASEGPDDHVKLFFPDPRTGALNLPGQADGHLDWPRGFRPTGRDYTPRSYDPAAGTFDLEFVLHGHGIAGTWAEAARVGDRLTIAGPKASTLMPQADWYVLAGDETALPAIGNWLEMLPDTARVQCVILIEDESARIPLKAPGGATIIWQHHDPARPDTLREAVSGLAFPEGRGFVWGAGERDAIRLLRAHLLDERGLEKSQIDVVAYWTCGADDAAERAAYARLRALSDLSAPFALRAAASLGLVDHVSSGATTAAALAEASGCRKEVLAPLLPLLIGLEVLAGSPEALALGPLGVILRDDSHMREDLDLGAVAGRRNLAWAGLNAALAGQDAYAQVNGSSYSEDANNRKYSVSYAHEQDHLIEDMAADAARRMVFSGPAHIVDCSGGEGAFLLEILEIHQSVTGTLVGRADVLAAARETIAATIHAPRVTLAETTPAGAEAYLLGGVLMQLDDSSAIARLAATADAMAPASRLFVLEPALATDPRGQIETLLVHWPQREHDAIPTLAARASLVAVQSHALPNGHVLLEFARG